MGHIPIVRTRILRLRLGGGECLLDQTAVGNTGLFGAICLGELLMKTPVERGQRVIRICTHTAGLGC